MWSDHIDHVRDVAGIDHIGIGSDFDGAPTMPEGLEDVSRYPALFEELASRGYRHEDLMQIVGRNLLRVHARGRAHGGAPARRAPAIRRRRSRSWRLERILRNTGLEDERASPQAISVAVMS
jgi:hypothetical protein